MSTPTPINGHPVPLNSEGPLGGTVIQTYAADAEKFSNMRVASTADRLTKIPSPVEGMETWRADANVKEIHDGVKWVPFIPGAKIVAQDTGAGGVGVTAGPVTVHPQRTVSDPFGTGVPFLLVIYAHVLTDSSTYTFGTGASFDLVVPALSANVAQRRRVGPGPSGASILYVQAFPSGGSQSYSTRLTEFAGGFSTTYYADLNANSATYLAFPLAT